jgi:hypothetical protein
VKVRAKDEANPILPGGIGIYAVDQEDFAHHGPPGKAEDARGTIALKYRLTSIIERDANDNHQNS